MATNGTTLLDSASLLLHPYYPLNIVMPSYVANTASTLEILLYFALGCVGILVSTYVYAKRVRPGLSNADVATVMWFVLSGTIHLGLEGYVVYHAAKIAGMQTFLAQAWKEYSLSDSRYLTQNSFVICMEAITAMFWGPLCLVVVRCIVNNDPLRHPLQLIVSLGQVYGDILYYATCAFDHIVSNIAYSRPDNYYSWWYFIFLNAIWLIIPLPLLIQSVRATAHAFRETRVIGNDRKSN